MPWWDATKIIELKQITDDHVDYCTECQRSLEMNDDEAHYCPVGENLLETYLNAEVEYSWQHDFDGYGNLKQKVAEYSILCPCDACFTKTMQQSFAT